MTAVVLIRKKRARKSLDSVDDFTKTEKLPPLNHISDDLVLDVLSAGKLVSCFQSGKKLVFVFVELHCNVLTEIFAHRAWQRRRFVYTRDSISFAHIGDDKVLDKIPLNEVVAVERVLSSANRALAPSLLALENAVDFSRSFQIRTIPNGYNAGRKYFLQAERDEICSDLVSTLHNFVRSAVLRSKSPGQRRQDLVRRIYNSNTIQSLAAVLIILVGKTDPFIVDLHGNKVFFSQNFFASITEAQMQGSLLNTDGSPTHAMIFLDNLNFVLTIVFTVELLTNMYAHWLVEFMTNSWAIFDLVVVTLSLVTLGPLNLPISVLRALRVLRLFGRFKALKKILSALSASIIPVLNAFFIMLIVSMICKSSLVHLLFDVTWLHGDSWLD
jgi:hypothetical protein